MRGQVSVEALFAFGIAAFIFVMIFPSLDLFTSNALEKLKMEKAERIAVEYCYFIAELNSMDFDANVLLDYLCVPSPNGCLDYNLSYDQGLLLEIPGAKIRVPCTYFEGKAEMKPGRKLLILRDDYGTRVLHV